MSFYRMALLEVRSSHWSWREIISSADVSDDADKTTDWPTAGV